MTSLITPRTLIGLSIVLLLLALLFGVLNADKVQSLRARVRHAGTIIDNSERRRLAQEIDAKTREAGLAVKFSEIADKMARAETELAKVRDEKTNLQSKLQVNEEQIADLHRQFEAKAKSPANPGAPSASELQAQLEETRTQLAAAERDKTLLSEKIRGVQDHLSQLDQGKKGHGLVGQKTGFRGTVLAVNQAYNFVVLSLGGRQGVELNSEMLIIRNGTLIGKIRVSSVEPSTAIGDIIVSSLARGVQVQPGDTVIYAGNS